MGEREWLARSSHGLRVGVAAIMLPCSIYAAEEKSFDFDIPAQPAALALQAIGREANAQVIFSPEQLRYVRTQPLFGRLTLQEAVSRLLAGTNVNFTVSQDGTVIVSRSDVAQATTSGSAEAPVSKPVSTAVKPKARSSSTGLEEIVVTARRRKEQLQRVPVSITAFASKDIESKRIETAQDLQQYVPSMAVYAFAAIRDGTQYSLRGQSTTTGATAGVVVYLNEVPMASDLASSSSGGGPGLYLDLDNLLVLNGPQGTLFGRNTTGGAVLLQSKRPTEKFEGYVQAALGNYAEREYEGVINMPLAGNKVMMRLAAKRQTSDGFTRNLITGQNLDNRDNWAGRASLSIHPSEAFENDLIYYGIDSRSDGTSRFITHVNPLGLSQLLYSGLSGTPSLQQALATQQARGLRTVINNPPATEAARYWSVTDIARWTLTDDIALKNIAAYQSIKSTNYGDTDGTAIPILFNFLSSHTITASEELQLQGTSLSDKLTWTLGGFIDYSKPEGPQNLNVTLFDGLSVPPITSNVTTGTQRRSRALYAQASYNLGGLATALEGLSFTTGYRYTWDYRSDFQTAATGATTGVERSTAGTWTLGLDYLIDPATFVYVKASRGYKAGGFNPSSLDPSFVTFKPEYVRDVEIGLKKDWTFDGVQIRTNVDAFHTDYTEIQKSVLVVVGGFPTTITENVAAATIDGIEVAGTLVPHPNFELSGTFSYLDAKYKSGTLGFNTELPFYFTPKTKFSVTGTVHVPIRADLGKASLSASYARTSSLFTAHKFETGDTLPGYGILNVRADWNGIAGKPIDLSFFMTNAANTDYQISSIPVYTDLGFTAGTYGEPRMYGVQLRFRWGADVPSLF